MFGYGIWGTIWRTVLSIGIIFYLFGIVMMAVFDFSGKFDSGHTTWSIIGMIVVLVAIGAALLWFGWWIGKKNAQTVE